MQSNNGPRTVLLDVGGTGIKGCISREGSDVMEMYREFPAKSDGSPKVIFDHFSAIIKTLGGGRTISGIGFAFPGSARMIFVHDTEAFALGCVCVRPAARHSKVMCLCIGTGAGSAFLRDGVVLKHEEYGAPPDGWIYSLPFRSMTMYPEEDWR